MDNFFDNVPPQDAVAQDVARYERVDCRLMKTAAAWVSKVDQAHMDEELKKGKLGFSWYDRDNKVTIPLPAFMFVVLESYSGIDGDNGEDGGNKVRYWSSRVKDTRTEELAVWASNHKGPVLKGIYKDFKEKMKATQVGAKFRQFLVCYDINNNRIIEIPVGAYLQTAIQQAMADAYARGGTSKSASSISLWGIADTDHLWTFKVNGYAPVDKEGKPYSGAGDAFYVPVMHATTLSPSLPAHKEAFTKSVQAQAQVRDNYAIQVEKRKRFAQEATTPANEYDVAEAAHYAAPAPPPDPIFDTPAPVKVQGPHPDDVIPDKAWLALKGQIENQLAVTTTPEALAASLGKLNAHFTTGPGKVHRHRLDDVKFMFDERLRELQGSSDMQFQFAEGANPAIITGIVPEVTRKRKEAVAAVGTFMGEDGTIQKEGDILPF
jgi:hypothetical protein